MYTVNTCVDAYNLVVLRHRVSVGAFDLDAITFPTVLRFAKDGDQILLHGDEQPTRYSSSELAYYDQSGGYNIDFNFRDAKRTLVTEKTTNLWINTEGVYDITPAQVMETLRETVSAITKYNGGTVEFSGLVS
jgi:DNA/RNA-binding domain of Phe-tRNA-synthetase-like protein